MSSLNSYIKKKEYLVCIDSDGCAMDTMDIKHFRCFGPCMVAEWDLSQWEKPILERWNELNLYTMTRGINRFKGLVLALTEVNAWYRPISGLRELAAWVESTKALSNDALEAAIAANPRSEILPKALAWSKAVNKAINALPESEIHPFPMAKEALAFAHRHADVAIVSSANPGAVKEEWEKHGLLPYTDILLAQDAGSKSYCIAQLLKKGYAPDKVLMCGDAPGDLDAAENNGVFYYPILVRRERESWDEFIREALGRLLNGTYNDNYQDLKKAAFLQNLGG